MKTLSVPHRMKRLALVPAAAGLLLAGAFSGQAAIIADFSGGEGTSQPDQFKGTAGEGWTEGWSSRNGSGGTTLFAVEDSQPLRSGGGNYLKVSYQRNAAGGSNRAGVARPFATSGPGGVDTTQAYTISFDFRIDELTGWDTSGDQIAFSSESVTTIGSFATTSPWALWLRADRPGWQVRNGNGAGGGEYLDFAELGLDTIEVGALYSMVVEVDPLTARYDLTIRIGGEVYRASDLNNGQWLGFGGSAAQAAAFNVLQFRATMSGATDGIVWSMDNLRVAAVPEADGLVLGLSGLMGLFFVLKCRQSLQRRKR